MTGFYPGARASCFDGACGVVSGTILDPAARTAGEVRLGYTLGLGHRTPLVVSQAVRKQGGHPGQRRRLG